MPWDFFGCKFTIEYILTGLAGGTVAVIILPGNYLALPRLVRSTNGELHLQLGAIARLIVAAVFGAVVDTSQRNAFFGGFFSWHACRWLSEDCWNMIAAKLPKNKGV